MSAEHVTLTAQCLCKAHTFETDIARSSLPLQAHSCHCNSCRHMSGAMYTSCVTWPGDSKAIQQALLHEYAFSPRLYVLSCPMCSSPMFWRPQPGAASYPGDYQAFTGALKNIDVPNLVQFGHHIFLGDTRDGGATPWLRTPNQDGTPARRWLGQPEQSQEIEGDWPPVDALPIATVKPQPEVEGVPFHCHCGGVDFVLRRADKEFEETAPAEVPWYIDPTTRKALASTECCDSCRLQSGTDVYHWTFALLRQITFSQLPSSASGQQHASFPTTTAALREAVTAPPENRDPRLGTLACHDSSPDVQRYFCRRCAACVFYCVDDRPDMTDIAMGLLDAPSGARAEEFVSWYLGGAMSWREDVAGGWREGHVQAVEAAAEAWRVQRGYPKNWLRAEKEKGEATRA